MRLLRPFSTATSATALGWHAEGPFIDMAKRGAHPPSFLLSAPEGIKSFDELYGTENLADTEDWLMSGTLGVRIITAAPEVNGVMGAVGELTRRGVVFSIGHRFDFMLLKFGKGTLMSYLQRRHFGHCYHSGQEWCSSYHPSIQCHAPASS